MVGVIWYRFVRYSGTDWSATLVPIGAMRWYRFIRYSGTDSPILSQENRTRKPDKKTGQENRTKKTDKKELRMEQIINFCREPKPLSEIMELIGLKHRENFMNIYINPLIDSGRLGMIDPNHPKSRNQMYVIKEN